MHSDLHSLLLAQQDFLKNRFSIDDALLLSEMQMLFRQARYRRGAVLPPANLALIMKGECSLTWSSSTTTYEVLKRNYHPTHSSKMRTIYFASLGGCLGRGGTTNLVSLRRGVCIARG